MIISRVSGKDEAWHTVDVGHAFDMPDRRTDTNKLGQAGSVAFDNLIWPTFDTFIWPTLRPLFCSFFRG